MITVKNNDEVLTVTINRPDKKNALTPSMYKAMADAINSAKDGDVRVVVIEGINGVFTSGNDVAEFASAQSTTGVNETVKFMQALLNCDVPVVAKVEGLAVGIGTTMLLHCDFVYAHKNAKFAMPFINLGLVPEYASSYLIPRFAGHLKAAKLLMLGEFFDVDVAKECEIITESSADDLQQTVDDVVTKLRNKPRTALIDTKKLLKSNKTFIKSHIDVELEVFASAMQRASAQEAFSAFLDKRPVNQKIFRE